MRILNLTQHAPTPEQVEAGVVEPADKGAVQALLTFESVPDRTEMVRRAKELAEMARVADAVMVGGAPFFMGTLESVLKTVLAVPVLYSFSRRESVEQTQPDGSVKKVAVFRHVGWVEV